MGRGKISALILLDLSAAFDRVDPSILLHRLEHWFGSSGIPLQWFKTYLDHRTQSVYCDGLQSNSSKMQYGVPFLSLAQNSGTLFL